MCPTTLVCTIKFTEDGLDRQKGDQFSVFNFHLPSNVQVGCGSWFISGLPGIYSQAANDEPQGTAVLAAGAWEYTRKMPQRWYSWRTAPVKSPCFFSPWVASITCNSTTYIYIYMIYIYISYILSITCFWGVFSWLLDKPIESIGLGFFIWWSCGEANKKPLTLRDDHYDIMLGGKHDEHYYSDTDTDIYIYICIDIIYYM